MSRILTTHVGSLPRPSDVFSLLEEKERSGKVPHDFAARIASAVSDIVSKQIEAGIDIVGDGEISKYSYTFYVRHRLAGVASLELTKRERPKTAAHRDLLEHPDFLEIVQAKTRGVNWYELVPPPVCQGPVSYIGLDALRVDLDNLRLAADSAHPTGTFVNAASPGVLTKFVPDDFYHDEDAYLDALIAAMRVEYEAIAAAGHILQIDAPDLASARHNQYQSLSDDEFLKIATRNVEAINAATASIPPEKMRMHVCWGNYEGPHTHDIPLKKIAEIVFSARPQAILFEGANPRHEHEWEDLRSVRVPTDKVLIPGVIDSTSNFVEHPQLVAQRICRYADIVGRDRVVAGTDCGFATFAGPNNPVAPSVVWAKFQSLSQGAELASRRLWGGSQ